LTFNRLERPHGTQDHIVNISARDKNLFKDNIIGRTSLPLSELLRHQGQREIDLFDKSSKLTGRVLMTVSGGEIVDQGSASGDQLAGVSASAGYALDAASREASNHVEHGLSGALDTDAGHTGLDTGLGTGHDGKGPLSIGQPGVHVLGTGLPGRIGSAQGSGSVVITVHTAQFTNDIGTFSKQDPYIMITIGDRTLKTKSISRAGKTAVWDETLMFTDLRGLDSKNQAVLIRARDKDVIKDDDIAQATLPLSELLSYQGQREYELFDHARTSVGRIWLTVSCDGEHLGSDGTNGTT